MAENEQTVDLSTLEFPSDPSKLPTSKELPLGEVELEITGWAADKTKPVNEGDQGYDKGNRGNKLRFIMSAKVTQPEEIAGMPYTHRIVVGSNTDPSAAKDATWASGGGTEVMKILNKSKTHLGASTKPREALLASVGQRLQGEVKIEKDRNGVYPDKHVVKAWHSVGEKPIGLVGGGSGLTAIRVPVEQVFENQD